MFTNGLVDRMIYFNIGMHIESLTDGSEADSIIGNSREFEGRRPLPGHVRHTRAPYTVMILQASVLGEEAESFA